MNILSLLKEQKGADLDAPSTTLEHRRILMEKPFLRKLYEEWYRSFLDKAGTVGTSGILLEVGAGGGFLKEICPWAICSDILPLPHCDLTFSATCMPLRDRTVRGIFLINVLHHIPDTRAFFREVERVLIPNGVLFMVEPANTPMGRLIYTRLHHEPFAPERTEWEFESHGPLSCANGALPWMIFTRDKSVFEAEFPDLVVSSVVLHTPFRYLVSGGLSYRSPLPGWSFAGATALEKLFSPLYQKLSLFQTIQVQRR